MSLIITEKKDGKILEIAASGTLTKEDYQRLVPEVDMQVRRHGKIRLLFEMTQFHGWEAKALWEELKLDVKHLHDVERVAGVGEKAWQKWLVNFTKPFTSAEVRYFDLTDSPQAKAWIEETVQFIPTT